MHVARFVIGVDIGGTKVKAGAVEIRGGALSNEVALGEQIASPRRNSAEFYDAITELIRMVTRRVEASGGAVLPILGVAHPGRFLADGTLARGTTPNLGLRPNEFDGFNPARELQRRLGGAWRVIAENDAIAQMRFALDALLRDPAVRASLLNHTVVYLGPGTGMGGGVARVGTAGEVTILTDGHLFDVQVPGIGDGTLTAEELFTGPAIARLAAERGLAPATAEHVSELLDGPNSRDRATALEIADRGAEILAALIETIRTGRIVKVRLEPIADGRIPRHIDEPDRVWSDADKAVVRGTSRFILAGSVGISTLGARLRDRALERLRQRGVTDLQILQSPAPSADAGVLGIVRAIPPQLLRFDKTQPPC